MSFESDASIIGGRAVKEPERGVPLVIRTSGVSFEPEMIEFLSKTIELENSEDFQSPEGPPESD